MNYEFGMGAFDSQKDDRTFTYAPITANKKGGSRWLPEDIEYQSRVGICTAISLTMHARKYYGIDFSDDFQYLCQKKLYDLNWMEGSSIFVALKVGKNIGFLPQSEWNHTTLEDRNLPYAEYIEKLKALPDAEIERLKLIASKYKLKAYASVPVDRDLLANAIDESGALLTRFTVGSEWWTNPIEPLREPISPVSGHAVNLTNYDGNSFRIANSWGPDWADKGTAYFLLNDYKPTEAWAVWFEDVPKEIDEQLKNKEKKELIDTIIQSLLKLKEII